MPASRIAEVSITDKNSSSEDLSKHKINPPLPTLWSSYDVPTTLLGKTQQQLDTIYENALASQNVYMPRSSVGKVVVPALCLGGPPFMYGYAFRTQRLLFGWIPPMVFLPMNLVLFPVGLLVGCAATLPLAYGIVAGLFCSWSWITAAGAVCVYEQTRYSTKVMQRALALGINHIETARHYLTSEAFIRPVVKSVGRKRLVLQTKVRPYEGARGFVDTVRECCNTLGVQKIDLLALHGVNKNSFAQEAKACAAAIVGKGMVESLGFSFHCRTDDAIELINSGKFSYVNCHFNFFGSYTNLTNERAVAAAHKRGMSVMCISPNHQSGHLHSPSVELLELCKPLHPMHFNMLFQLTYPGVSCTSIGPGRLEHFQLPEEVLKLLPVAKELLPTIVHRLRTRAKERLGERFLNGCDAAVGPLAQGAGEWGDEEHAAPIAVCLLTMCASLNRAFALKSFGKAMHTNLSWPGDWCCGKNADSVPGREEDIRRNLDLRRSGGIWVEEDREQCISMLRNYKREFGIPDGKSGATAMQGGGLASRFLKCINEALFAYVFWWMRYSSSLFGFTQTKEHGSMPTTAN